MSEDKASTRKRSTSYPSINLEEAIQRLSSLNQAYGMSKYSREDAAKGIGYGGLSGASARAVAALVQYGLLERDGNAYTPSSLAKGILFPVSDEEKAKSIKMAAQSPRLFAIIVNQYKGQSLPTMLENVLMRQGIHGGASKEAASAIRDSFAFAGLLKNGIVSLNTQNEQDPSLGKDTLVEVEENENSGTFTDVETPTLKGKYSYSDTGTGWSIFVKSAVPLSSDVKKALLDIADKLVQINKEQDV